MVSRRDWLKITAAAGAALSLPPSLLRAIEGGTLRQELIRRAVPSTGEQLPIVGLGSSATFSQVARSEDYSQLGQVLSAMVEHGGTVFDTAPGYGASEEVAGRIANDLGIDQDIFWATKVNVAGRGDGVADPDAARAQIATSFERIQKHPIDLIQVHNLGDIPTQMGILKEMKEEGRIRYIGVTSTSEGRYGDLADVMRNEPVDFIGVDYAVDNRSAEEMILPLAQERGIGVLVYAPFGRTRLWNRVDGRDVPAWASEFDATSWAQFFIKFAASHPAVTVVTPATSRPEHMIDNMGGAMGRIPDDSERRRMIELVEGLPMA
ncbi:MAG: aldo/keto reductase [Gemmatimonadales bacterium]|nr:MAG: aldo/keto reductase [Gemmatimonadales bacterium]